MRTNRRTFAAAEVNPRSCLEPLEISAIFGRPSPLEVDLGCGDGSFLVALARQNPERNFVGVERLPGRVRSASRKIGHLNLTNARVVQHDILHAVQQLFAPGTVDVFHLMFPDPWPKRRHYDRRIVRPEFLRAISRALKADGQMRIATDHNDYFAWMQETLAAFPGLETEIDASGLPITTFEERFRGRGLTIHRLRLRKVSPSR